MEIKVFLKVYIHRKRKEKGEIGIKMKKSYIVPKLLKGGLQFFCGKNRIKMGKKRCMMFNCQMQRNIWLENVFLAVMCPPWLNIFVKSYLHKCCIEKASFLHELNLYLFALFKLIQQILLWNGFLLSWSADFSASKF